MMPSVNAYYTENVTSTYSYELTVWLGLAGGDAFVMSDLAVCLC